MVMSQYQNAGQSHIMRTDNRSFERVKEFKYLGTTLTNKNSIQTEITVMLAVFRRRIFFLVCYQKI